MADDGSKQSANVWPLPKFQFLVQMGGMQINFEEVSGLNAETQVIEYRGGNSKLYSTIKMPGIQKFGNVIMKRGILKGDKDLWDKFSLMGRNTLKRETVSISLLDESGKPTMTWKLTNAFLYAIKGTEMKSEGNEVAIESIEIAHEGLTIVNK